MKVSRDEVIAYAFYLLFVLIVSGAGYMVFDYERDELYRDVDDKLLTVAKGATYLLAPDFHDRAQSPHAIDGEEDLRNVRRLTHVAEYYGISYVYTMIEKNGNIYFTSSSATDEQIKTGENLTRYFDLYEEASPAVREAFWNEEAVFVEETDRWGTFRSVLIPMRSSRGYLYLSGADISIDMLKERIREKAYEQIWISLLLILLSIPIFLWMLHLIKHSNANPELLCDV